MFKTHFRITKELVIAFTLSSVVIALLVLNIMVIVSTVNDVYFSHPVSQKSQSIDANTVSTAIDILNQ